MNKFKIFLFFKIIFIFSISSIHSSQINQFCNSKIGSLNKPNEIEYIEVKINKSRKWTRNLIKAYLSTSTFIDEKFRKRFKSELRVFFKDGSICNFTAKTRINGDMRDHIQIVNNQIISSMNINISGHLNNTTQIKLLLPKTRKGDNEIFISTVLRELNYLSPKISNVKVKMFNRELIFQMHESVHRKEFLENLGRKENPILSKDEYFEMHDDKSFSGLGLARVRNAKWIKNDNDKFISSVNALTKMNIYFITLFNTNREDTYPLMSTFDGYEDNFFSNSIYNDKKKFNSYNALIQAFEADAHMSSTDSRYYYNALTENFEPIYNDGFSNFLGFTKNIKKEIVNANIIDGAKRAIDEVKKIDVNKLNKKLEENNVYFEISKVENLLNKLILRLDEISKVKIQNNKENLYLNFNIDNYLDKLIEKNYGYITYNYFDDNFNFCKTKYKSECKIKKISFSDKKKILEQRFEVDNFIYLFLGNKDIFLPELALNKQFTKFKNIYNQDFKIFSNNDEKIKINEKNKTVEIFIEKENTRILFSDGEMKDWKISFNDNRTLSSQLVNNITGCVTIYKMLIKNLKLISNNSKCEDAFNLIDTKGSIKEINVKSSNFDAIDFDFSEILIEKIFIDNSVNDCIDFSFGKYLILDAELNDCKDKGVSVGEKSTLQINKILVKNSLIGVASKDSSYVSINNGELVNNKTCLAAYNKKSEFDGGKIEFKNLFCKNSENKFQIDAFSQISKNEN